jgi:hypothetical protein
MNKYLLIFLFACGGGSDPAPMNTELPHVTTEVSDITSTSVTVGGKITDDGGLGIIEQGVVVNNFTITISGGFSTSIRVDPLETYVVKAYARNAKGIAYGSAVSFVANCPSGFMQSVDYSTVSIATAGSMCSTSGTVMFNEFKEGQYTVSDISFGLYGCAWNDDPAAGVILNDLCGKIFLTGTDQYSGAYSWVIVSNNGTQLVISWANDFGDEAQTTLTGTWPLNLHL